jgi:hypothetical protein
MGAGQNRGSDTLVAGSVVALSVLCCAGLPLLLAAGLSTGIAFALGGAVIGGAVLVGAVIFLVLRTRARTSAAARESAEVAYASRSKPASSASSPNSNC